MKDKAPERHDPYVAVAFVMATLGRPEAARNAQALLEICGPQDSVTVVCKSEAALELRQQLNPRILLVSHSRPGASAARNIGIDVVRNAAPWTTHFVFPNDRSSMDQFAMEALRHRARQDPRAIIIGSWSITDWGSQHRPGFHRGTVSLPRAIANAYEPAIVIPSDVVEAGIRWSEVICPGARSPWHASDGPELILSAVAKGISAVVDYDVRIDNVSTSFDLDRRARRNKYFAYARGAGLVHQRHLATLGLPVVCLGTVGPLLGWVLGRPYWRKVGLGLALIATVGRFVGMAEAIGQRYERVDDRWRRSNESTGPYRVMSSP